jgi:Ca2+-binding RTX toxin-like protein
MHLPTQYKRAPAMTLAATAATVAAFAASATPASAAASSATINGTTATLNLDAANDNETVSVANGLVVHSAVGGGLNSSSDWDSTEPGDQTVPADGTFTIVVNGGEGNDSLTVLAKTTEIASATLNGEAGDDVLTGADTNDVLNGGEGNDRLIGAKGTDLMDGGGGNDTLVWNNGDGSDRMNGEAGTDTAEVNGSSTLGDVFTLAPEPGGVKFQRTNLVPFTLDTATERFQVNGLGGSDSVSAADGVGALTLLTVDGGTGDDMISGSDGPDVLLGGDGNDVIEGRGGDDRIVGDRGSDTMSGGAGDDTLVWNNGDGSDVIEGGEGHDDVEVNGSPTAGDVFTIQPNGSRMKFDRTNLVSFSLDIGSSESLHANGLGGDDTITVGNVGAFSVTASGGSGNDTLTGGDSSETFLGGSGNDTITSGGGSDVVFGEEGDDQVNIRDHTADVAFGGAGNDTVIADPGNLDVFNGFETVDRTPNPEPTPGGPPPGTPPHVTPPPVTPPAHVNPASPVTIRGGEVSVRNGRASIRVACPAGSSASCTGSLVLRVVVTGKHGKSSAGVRVGSVRYDVAPGRSRTVAVKLNKAGERVIGRTGRLAVKAVATTAGAGNVAQSTRRVTLVLRGTKLR